MPKYLVYLGKRVTDRLRCEVELDAESPEDAKAKALAQVEVNPESFDDKWRFGEAGDSGEITAYDVALLDESETSA